MITFLINNNGYTIERLIHGRGVEYNNIAPWQYLEFPSALGAPADGPYDVQIVKATTWGELNAVFADDQFQTRRGLRLVEVIPNTYDAPEALKAMTTRNVKAYQQKNQ